MANVKNFGLIGVGSDLQFGKAGTRIINNAGVFTLKAANGTLDAALTAAGITSSGNLTLSTQAGKVIIDGTDILGKTANGHTHLFGTSGVVLPTGSTAQRGTAELGQIRVNNDVENAATVEFYDGDNWVNLATGGSTGDLQAEIDAIETSLGASVNTDGTFNSAVFTDSAAGATSITNAINLVAAAAANKDTLDEILPGTNGQIIYNANGTWVAGSITGTASRVVVTDGGALGGPTVDLAEVTQGDTGSFLKVTVDGYGRVTGNTEVVASDITDLVDSTYVNVTGDTMSGALNMGDNKITGLAAPTAGGDATNKAYVDNAISGLSWKQAVDLLANTNVALTGTFEVLTIDGRDLSTVDVGTRVLFINQTDPAENGIYVLTEAAGGGYEFVRSLDADTGVELEGAAVFVISGNTYDNTGWVQSSDTLDGFTGQHWVQFSGGGAYSAGDGLALTGTTFSVNMGAGITTLPSDEVGIDVASGTALQLTTTASNGQLTLVLASGSGLSQSASGLTIAEGGVTNSMLVNSGFALSADSGTGAVALGGTLSVTSADSAITVTADTNTLSIQLNTVDVAHGGTGLTSVNPNQVLFGGESNSIAQTADFVFDSATNTLTVGTATIAAPAAGDVTITATATNGDINLIPNGTGAVVIGNPGAGVIASDAGQTLTITGNNTLVLESTSGDVVLKLAAGATDKVTVSGPTAAEYATGLADADLVNKLYVDQGAATAAAGSVKAVKATVNLGVTGATNIGAALPAGATILRVKVQVTSADTGTGTLVIGKAEATNAYMTDVESDTQTLGMYLAETYAVEAASTQVIATVAGSAVSGSANVIVEYQLD